MKFLCVRFIYDVNLIFLNIGNKHNLTTQCEDELFIKHNPHHITEALYGHQ
jgi:hypothetical protein